MVPIFVGYVSYEKLRPTWPSVVPPKQPSRPPKLVQNFGFFSDLFISLQDKPNMAPRAPQERPKSAPRASKSAPRVPKNAPRAPKRAPRAAQSSPSAPRVHKNTQQIRRTPQKHLKTFKNVQKRIKMSKSKQNTHENTWEYIKTNNITHEALQGAITDTHVAPKSTPRAQKHRKTHHTMQTHEIICKNVL